MNRQGWLAGFRSAVSKIKAQVYHEEFKILKPIPSLTALNEPGEPAKGTPSVRLTDNLVLPNQEYALCSRFRLQRLREADTREQGKLLMAITGNAGRLPLELS